MRVCQSKCLYVKGTICPTNGGVQVQSTRSDGGKSSGRGPSADALAFSGLVGGDEIFQLFDNSVYKLLLVPFIFTELSEHVVLAAGVLHLL